MSARQLTNDASSGELVTLRLILVSGRTREFSFPPSISATEVTQHVFDNWPQEWEEESVESASLLKLIYHGRFLHGSVTLAALALPPGKTTVMHLVTRENLPEPNSNDSLSKRKRGGCCRCTKEKSSDKENGHRSTKKQKPRTPTPEPPKAVQADEYEYEDDFEVYEEDFEEDVEDEVPHDTTQKGRDAQQGEGTQQKAAEVVEENGSPESTQRTARADEYEVVKDEDDTPMLRRLRTAQGGRTPIRPPASVIQAKPNDIVEQIDRHPSAGRRIAVADTDVAMPMNFGSDGDLQRRYETLKQLIGLESVGFRVLERPPIRDYNLYLEIFGDSGKTQSYSQTGDDNVNEETQTDELNGNNIWTQHPPGDLFGCGTDADAHVVITDEDLAREVMNIFYKSSAGDPKLVDFVNTAAKVMLKYLGERKSAYVEMNNRSEAAFSSGYNVLTLGQLSKGSRCNVLLRPILEEHTVLCVFYVKDSVAEDLIQKSLLVEFFMDDIRPPKRVFVSEGEVKCCAYSPDGTVLFGGVADGSCVAWDLLEPAANYANEIPWPDSKDDIVLRSPAYDTSFLSSTFSSNNKTAACVSITIINNPKTQTYQVACLDECGTISVWSVLRDAQTADNLGSRPESTLAMGLTALLRPDSAILR
ncbi:unnamed protein product, partial [Mesorhabditis spiculigera]